MKTDGYKVTISGTLPVDVSSKKALQSTAALIAEAEAGQDPAKLVRRLEDVSVTVQDGSKPKAKRKAKPGGKKRGPKPKQAKLPLEPEDAKPADPPSNND